MGLSRKELFDYLRAYAEKEDKSAMEAARTHKMELLQVFLSGDEAKEVCSLDKLFYDSNHLHALVKFIDGKTYHIQLTEVRDD